MNTICYDGDVVTTIQHPDGRKKELSTQNIEIVPDSALLFYLADTEPGSSGSPVFKNGKVVAIHHSSHEHDMYNLGTFCKDILSYVENRTRK